MDRKESASAKNYDDMDNNERGLDAPNQGSDAIWNTQDLKAKTRELIYGDGDDVNQHASVLSKETGVDNHNIEAAPAAFEVTLNNTVLTPTTTIGAQRVSGIYGRGESTTSVAFADFDEYDTESTVAVATTTSADAYWQTRRASLVSPLSLVSSLSDSAASYLVEATTVPELVSARAIPMTPISEDGQHHDEQDREHVDGDNKDNHNVVKGSVSLCRRRRGLCLVVALFVTVIVALALGVALGKSLHVKTNNRNNASTTSSESPNNTSTFSNNNTNNTFQHPAVPTSAPTTNNNVQIFLTTLNAGRCNSGYMFDITAKTNIDLLALQINMNTRATQLIEVWTKKGPFHGFENNRSSWTFLAQTNVTPSPSQNNHLVPLPRNLFSPIHATAGSRQALYVTTTREKVICFQVTLKSLVGIVSYESVAYNTTDFDLDVGTGVTYPFAGIGVPSIFSGILEYERTGS